MATDRELRTEVLQTLYDNRVKRGGHVHLPTPSLEHIGSERLEMIARHLDQHGLIEWKGHMSGGGLARITASGIDVIEGIENPPIAMNVFLGSSSHVHNTATGQNAKINNHSHDQSTNVAIGGDVFGGLKTALQAGVSDPQQLSQMLAAVDDMKQKQGGAGFAAAYQKFVAVCADHIGIVAPFLPALTGMIPT